ncbi:Tumor protein p63 regulated [Cichlidogyrus casuarinus]|uniref:Tumor protein p63 regulated n=1 Tax=Cichlidogyrus casuarinus TaxID=1844966 RepID=A0ABD2Q2U1_9PLAT
MNFADVLEKIPKPSDITGHLPHVSVPSLPIFSGSKNEDAGRSPLHMTRDDMQIMLDLIQQSVLAPEDGAFGALWILTYIDHWNNEHERLVVLTERAFYIIKFDFIARKVKDIRRVGIGQVVNVVTGPLTYPSKSLMPMRTSPGVQINWGDTNDVSVTQKWNPLCRNLPYAIFTHHPVLIKLNQLPQGQTSFPGLGIGNDTAPGAPYDVNNFLNALKDACSGQSVSFNNGEILIESYGNLGSVVFNQTNLGFAKDKNVANGEEAAHAHQ